MAYNRISIFYFLNKTERTFEIRSNITIFSFTGYLSYYLEQ